MNIAQIQKAMQQEGLDCWLIYDFQGTNPIMSQVLRTRLVTSRRVFLIFSTTEEPKILGSRVDGDLLRQLPFPSILYTSWQEMEKKLGQLLAAYRVAGLDYSPGNALPTASRVDAGTLEMIKSLGKEVVSAANVFQAATAVWGEAVLAAHLEDCQRVAEIKDEAFDYIAVSLRQGQRLTEYDAHEFILQRFAEAGLTTPDGPVVAVNANSSDPHYAPSLERHALIQKGDWILIDLWAKRRGYEFVFADMAWVALAGATPSAQQQEIFKLVTAARDKAVAFIREAVQQQRSLEGWQVDDAVRQHITEAGYGHAFFHRTGHSLGPGEQVHATGVNLDNLETHDTRRLMPGIGFTIEPGIYLPEFGVRCEINVYMAEDGPLVTTPVQEEIICLEV